MWRTQYHSHHPQNHHFYGWDFNHPEMVGLWHWLPTYPTLNTLSLGLIMGCPNHPQSNSHHTLAQGWGWWWWWWWWRWRWRWCSSNDHSKSEWLSCSCSAIHSSPASHPWPNCSCSMRQSPWYSSAAAMGRPLDNKHTRAGAKTSGCWR